MDVRIARNNDALFNSGAEPEPVATVRVNERDRFDAIYRQQYPAIVRLITLITGDPSDVQEVAQEAFVRWYARKATVDNPEAYLRTTAINLLRGRFRRKKTTRRFAPLLETEALLASGRISPDPDVLTDVIAKLPDRQRAAVVLRYYEGRSEAEIARILECQPGTVKSLLSRALHEMRRVIEPVGEGK
jgi:RNA polymerase sigma factor (sigma-70 family)